MCANTFNCTISYRIKVSCHRIKKVQWKLWMLHPWIAIFRHSGNDGWIFRQPSLAIKLIKLYKTQTQSCVALLCSFKKYYYYNYHQLVDLIYWHPTYIYIDFFQQAQRGWYKSYKCVALYILVWKKVVLHILVKYCIFNNDSCTTFLLTRKHSGVALLKIIWHCSAVLMYSQWIVKKMDMILTFFMIWKYFKLIKLSKSFFFFFLWLLLLYIYYKY